MSNLTKQTKSQVVAHIKKHGVWHGFLCPNRCFPHPNHPFNLAMETEVVAADLTFDEFENTINQFMYYNCNAETGHRVHYYLKEEKDND